MPCPFWFPSRPVLRWRSVLSGAAPGLHMSLLWQDGLHRDLPAGARGCRAHRDLHRSGKLVLKLHTQPSMRPWLDVCADLNNRKHLHLCWFFLTCVRIESVSENVPHIRRPSRFWKYAVVCLHLIRRPSSDVSFWLYSALFIDAHCFSSDSEKTLVWTAEKYLAHGL